VFIESGEAVVFFAVISYFLFNLANLLYCRRFKRDSFGWFSTGVVPVAGMVILVYAL
jgi:hypothetical protein